MLDDARLKTEVVDVIQNKLPVVVKLFVCALDIRFANCIVISKECLNFLFFKEDRRMVDSCPLKVICRVISECSARLSH